VFVTGGSALRLTYTVPKTKEERLSNLRKSLIYLGKRGVDINSLEPTGNYTFYLTFI